MTDSAPAPAAGDDASRPASASVSNGAAPARAATVTNVSGDATRPAGGSVSGGAAPAADGARGSVAGRPTSPSNAAASTAAAEPTKTEEPARPAGGSVSGDASRPASGSVSNGGAANGSGKLGSVPEDSVAPRQSVSKSSPVPDSAPVPVAAAAATATESKSETKTAETKPAATGAMADRDAKKNDLAGGDKQISVPRPVEDVKRELEQGSLRCTEAWSGKIDALRALKPDDNSVRYMGFVQENTSDPNSRQALFYVESGKKESANPSDKPYRLLKLSELPESKEAVHLMYLSSPIVYAAAAGRNDIVSLLIDRFALDYSKEQSIYTAAWDEASKKWVVDNSQSKHVSAGMVGVANGYEEVAHGGCRMCASGDCNIM